ncbi:MAG TPA: VWA domain-containing protein [Pyrinomonadaceae bacterium]|jgi:VWFA-related protein|nr:VWA domain-containing protein [Pyrinomonadaceae bacterium]
MLSNKRFVRVLALALAVASASAGAGARAQQQTQPPPAAQQQKKPAQRPDETIDEDEVERVETDLANVLFTATDRNKRFIRNIQQEDITVLEDGVAQQVFTFQRNVDLPLSLAILIDTSNSQERTLPEEKRAAQQFVDTVIRPNKDEVAVLTFTGETTLEQGLTGSASRARRAIERVEFQPPSGYIGGGLVVTTPGGVGGGTPPISGDNQNRAGSTAIWDSIWVVSREVLSETSDKTRRAIILLTDGDDTSSRMKLNEAIDSALKADAIIYAIGIGDSFSFSGVDEGSLRKITERTGGRAYFPRNETDLRSAFAQIQDELREQYLVAYSPSNKAKDGTFRKVQIDFKDPELRKNMKLTYRQGYFARSAVDAKPRK